MKIKFMLIPLGTGGALSSRNYNSNYCLEAYVNGDMGAKCESLLIDCGTDVKHSLMETRRRDISQIDSVFISHLHGDHCGGLETLGFSTFFNPYFKRPKLFIAEPLVGTLWHEVLSGTMRNTNEGVNSLSSYFDVRSISLDNPSFMWMGVEFHLIRVPHIENDYSVFYSFGLYFNIEGKKIFITCDTKFCPDKLIRIYSEADLIIHDCDTLIDSNGEPLRSNVHAHYYDLMTLPDSIRKKMYLTHYGDNVHSYECGVFFDRSPRKDGFKGWLIKGKDLL